MDISESKPIEINFQERTHVLICGSTLLACQLALASAQAGRQRYEQHLE